MGKLVIKVEHLSKIYKLYNKPIDRLKESLSITNKIYYKKFFALNDISFEIYKGETIGILGKNGAGKSTLLKIITGVLSPSEGEAKVEGKISALLELGAGFNPEYTGIENIYLNGTMMGFDRKEMEERIKPIVEFADIGEFINQPVKSYSSGMFARLAFAVAINVEPEILIVDEALSVGDTKFQIKCMNRMKKMMEGGTTVLFVSHDTNAIRRFCNRAIWLNNGEIVRDGEVNTVADEYIDFLKCSDIDELPLKEVQIVKKTEDKVLPEFKPNNSIAEIIDFLVLNKNGVIGDQIYYDEYIKVEVTYDVYDENVINPVLGVAVRSIDDDYTCGLNTLLDNVTIPWKYGRNKFSIEYPYGLRAIGGKYYFETALMDQTATVAIQYIQHIKEFTIISNYKGEGRYIMPHKWEDSINE